MTEVTLTPEQLAIVEHPLEPLRVAAGAGTGKTSTIVWRLCRAIDTGELEPEQALGLTFTNKAAEELADRLRKELPRLAAEGREVEVTTYHGFAHRLLREFGALVGVERDTDVIGQGYVRQLLLESLGGATYEHLDMTAPAHRVADAATLARQMGENLVTPEAFSTRVCSDDIDHARLELASIVAAYQQAKRRLGVVDYADLIARACELVAEHPDLAARIRNRYRVVLLDEYQDTDPSQRVLLQSLFGDGAAVTAVGDANQTIYEWRGASLENFAGFPHHFRNGDGSTATTKPLTLNRRSGRVILDVANAITRELHGEDAEELRPSPEASRGHVGVGFFRTAVEEATWIADEIRRLHDEEGVPWSEVAVLFRKNRHIPLVRDALEAAEIPLEVVSLGGLLTVPEVIDLHAWLRVIEMPDDSAALVRILRHGRFRLGLGDVAVIGRWVRAKRGTERDDTDEGPGWPLLEAIDRLDEIEGLTPEARDRVAEFRRMYRTLLTAAQSVSLVEICRRVLDEIEAWSEIEAMPSDRALTARLNLYRFLDLAEAWSPLRGRPSLAAFLGYLDVLQDERATEELDTARVSGEEAVSLLTVHRAKGLEWDAVFIPAVVDQSFPSKSLGYDNPVEKAQYLPYDLRLDAHTFPSDVTAKQLADELKDRHRAQEWRTAYVAVTRARHTLTLTGAYWYGAATKRPPSALYSLVESVPGVDVLHECDDAGVRPEQLALPDLEGAPDPLFGDAGWIGAIRRVVEGAGMSEVTGRALPPTYDADVDQLRIMLDGLPEPLTSAAADTLFSVSVTGLVTLATCPKRFYWSEVDRLPRRPSKAARRGVEFHRRVELHHHGVMPFEDVDPELYDAVADASAEGDMEGDGPHDTGAPFEAFLESRFAGAKPAFVEVPIDLRVADARVAGRVDAVYELRPGAWEIVDFKSGRPTDNDAARVQLEAYAVAAVDGAIASAPPDEIRVTFAYFGGGEAVERSESVDDEWLETARRRLESLVDTARGTEFPASPSPTCRRCDFLRFCPEGRSFVAGSV